MINHKLDIEACVDLEGIKAYIMDPQNKNDLLLGGDFNGDPISIKSLKYKLTKYERCVKNRQKLYNKLKRIGRRL